MAETSYIKGVDILYERAIKSIKKSDIKLQPIYEAFTNSLESLFGTGEDIVGPQIIIRLFHKMLIEDVYDFDYMEIEDNGPGFNENNFNRFKMWCDDRKSSRNRGAGRVQFLHYLESSEYYSVFKNADREYMERKFLLSKSNVFRIKNAIIKNLGIKDTKETERKTVLKLSGLLNEKDEKFYNGMTTPKLKEALISHYLPWFCALRNNLPFIKIEQYYNTEIKNEESQYIIQKDIPEFDKKKEIILNYSKISDDGKSVEKSSGTEKISLEAFKIPENQLKENAIKLTVKSEIVEDKNIKLVNLSAKDQINGRRYLFLLSGDYLDELDGNTRGDFSIPTIEEFKKKHTESSLFEVEEILLDVIEEETNRNIESMYEEINEQADKKQGEIEKLKKMFLLNGDTIKALHFSISDSEEKILEKVYSSDAKIIAKRDAEIKKNIESLSELNLTSENYDDSFNSIISKLATAIPVQNRNALTHYVARRKLVLELFDRILERNLEIQKSNSRNIDEKLLHNLIFQQSTDNPEKSDLWIVNEDFIYFKGTSEEKLSNIKIDGVKVIKEGLTTEEDKYRLTLGEDRLKKRPDVLLFPDEQKCIVIEFKNPDVNLSEHLTQLNNYASLIMNLSKPEFKFTTFYGYLIGEKITADDVRAHDADFKHAYHFDYVFRPNKTIAGMFGRNDGALYTEVIKYSTLLERAKKRNKIFINKITDNMMIKSEINEQNTNDSKTSSKYSGT